MQKKKDYNQPKTVEICVTGSKLLDSSEGDLGGTADPRAKSGFRYDEQPWDEF